MVACGARATEVRLALENLFWGESEKFSNGVRTSIESERSAFERAALLTDLDEVETFASRDREGMAKGNQLALL